MKYYIDITLLPGSEISLGFLWQKVYQQIHLALVEIQENGKVSVGVAFPGYDSNKRCLGNKLRLFAPNEKDLTKLNLESFLVKLSDYIQISKVLSVPENIDGYVLFKRVQLKNNNERLARRRAKRKGLSYQQALEHFDGRREAFVKMPFIQVKSHSTGKAYRLMISRQQTENTSTVTDFSTYGLSSCSPVPLF